MLLYLCKNPQITLPEIIQIAKMPSIDALVAEYLTKLLDNYSFYYLLSQNPDGRDHWFTDVNNSSSSRSNRRPVDNDKDGLVDEDQPEDLDGDGSITQMWKDVHCSS